MTRDTRSSLDDIAALNALANGIIRSDKTDDGAAMVFAGLGAYNVFDKPWGGFQESGWGREKNPYRLDLFTQINSVSINFT